MFYGAITSPSKEEDIEILARILARRFLLGGPEVTCFGKKSSTLLTLIA